MTDLCIFAHYDRDAMVDPYVFHYLKAIRDSGFEIVFVSTVSLNDETTARLREQCRDVILRSNIGHDFGSWAIGLARHRQQVRGRLLLANDSVYGPVGSLRQSIEQLTAAPADFYGMVLSHEVAPHLQSWFLLFEPHVVGSEAFAEIFCQPVANRSRDDVIRELELRATSHLQSAGYRCRALFESGDRRIIGNPTVYLWRQLVEQDGVPFLKVAILRDDPGWTAQEVKWRPFLEAKDHAIYTLVDGHFRRMRGGPQVSVKRRNIPAPLLRGYAFVRQYSITTDDRLVRQQRLILLALHGILFGGTDRALRRLFGLVSAAGRGLSALLPRS